MGQTDSQVALRWTTDSRYYRALVQQNLFGQWELVRAWGGRGSRLGGFLVRPAASRADAINMLEQEGRRRASRCYRQA